MSEDTSTEIALTTEELSKVLLQFKGRPLVLDDYIPFKEIYNLEPQQMTTKVARQSGKTLMVGAMLVLRSLQRPYFISLYVCPLSNQSSRFSSLYLDPIISSPMVKKLFKGRGSTNNVFQKDFSNSSKIFLSYAETEQDADRIRGLCLDGLNFDEVQDISLDAIPIIREALTASEYGNIRYCGTPKSEQNTLE